MEGSGALLHLARSFHERDMIVEVSCNEFLIHNVMLLMSAERPCAALVDTEWTRWKLMQGSAYWDRCRWQSIWHDLGCRLWSVMKLFVGMEAKNLLSRLWLGWRLHRCSCNTLSIWMKHDNIWRERWVQPCQPCTLSLPHIWLSFYPGSNKVL